MTTQIKSQINLTDLTEKLVENIEIVLRKLGISVYNKYSNRVAFPCPIHGGDNEEGCTIFTEPKNGTDMVGNWRCWTHGCQEENNQLLGFIQMCLSDSKPISFSETIEWCLDIVDGSYEPSKRAPRQINYHVEGTLSRPEVRKNLEIPSSYYIDRGYNKEVLEKYDVGLCKTQGKKMFLRVVVPVYDDNFKFVGCCGRTIQPECEKCGFYHFENRKCPENKIEKLWGSKWRNFGDFSGCVLYNHWYAVPHIYKTKTAILVEGAGNVWRMEEACIHIGLGMFKTVTSPGQEYVLKKLPISNLIIATDNDKAGLEGREKLIKKFSDSYNIYEAHFETDIGGASIEEAKDIFNPIFRKIGI